MSLLEAWGRIAGPGVIAQLRQLAGALTGARVVHVNSTRVGGGVAEILTKLVPAMNELGIRTEWEVVSGPAEFYQCTKAMHNGLQGNPVAIPEALLRTFEAVSADNAARLEGTLRDADVVFIHDPQPALLLRHMPERRGHWIWRCHIDLSRPHRPVWRYLRPAVSEYDASIFSLDEFAPRMPHPVYLIPPSIDPLSEKNVELEEREVEAVRERFGLEAGRPLIAQISRFDRFKDPLGVIAAYRLAKRYAPGLQLVLAGGEAPDDPEGETVYGEVRTAAQDDPDIHLLLLPADAHRTINALQRAADIVVQKSTREGFGLTVTEGMWKGRPVIGGNVGGIRLQVVNHQTGYLVSTPEGAALRIRYLLKNSELRHAMGARAREFVRENFLITRHLREYLGLMVAIKHGSNDRIELG